MTTINKPAMKARNLLLAMFFLLTILDSVLVVVSRDLWAIGRIIITIIVMYYVMEGKKWAKWTLLAILGLVIVLLSGLVIALHSKLSTFLVVGSLILIVFDLIAGGLMIFDRNLADYFALKRKAVRDRG